MSINLRTYRASDLPTLYVVDTLCFAAPFRFSREAIGQFAEAENAIVRVAADQSDPAGRESIAGFCIVHLEEADGNLAGYVVTLDVHPDWRRRGIGPALMRAVESAARDAGAQAMELHVWTGNEGAIRLYERLGYRYTRSAKEFYGEGLDALVYRKLLERRARSAELG